MRLFILSATLLRSRTDGSTDIATTHEYRATVGGADAAIGRFVQEVMEGHPGFVLSGKALCTEIDAKVVRKVAASQAVANV